MQRLSTQTRLFCMVKIDLVSLMIQAAGDVWRTLVLPLWWVWILLAGISALRFFYPQVLSVRRSR